MAEPSPPPGFVPLQPSASAPPAPPPGFVPVDAPGLLESFGRGAAEGATFGFDDKLGLDKERREASRKANPWTHFAGEMIGGILPMVGSGGIGAAVKGTGLAARGVRGAASLMTPGEINTIGQAAAQGAKLGAVYGGLSGAGHADVKPTDGYAEALAKRGVGAATGAAEGAVIGPVLGVAGHGLYRGAQALGGMKAAAAAETDNLGSGALTTAVHRLERDRITPSELIAQIRSEFPDDTAIGGANRYWGSSANRQPITADHVEEVVRRAMAGESAAEISAALKASGGGSGPGEAAVRTLLSELADRHLGPLNIVDRASMVRPGAGDNTQMTMRAATATPGEHLGIAREKLLERQIGAQGRLGQLMDRTVGSADYDGVAARHAAEMERAGDKAYAAAMEHEQPFDLNPLLTQWRERYAGQRGPVPEGIQKAVGSQYAEVPIPPSGLPGVGTAAGPRVTKAMHLPLDERQTLLEMWKFAKKKIDPPESLTSYLVRNGGVKDPGGDIASMLGKANLRPGLINNKTGRNLDDMTLNAWESRFLDGENRPAINDLLDAISRDLSGDRVVSRYSQQTMDDIAMQRQMLRDLEDVGVRGPNTAAVMEQLGFTPAKGSAAATSMEVAPQNLEGFINARQNLRQMKDEAAPGSPLQKRLIELYNDVTDEVSRTNPEWAKANALWRDGKAAEESMKAGALMSTRLNANSRENLKVFTDAAARAKKYGAGTPERTAAEAEMKLFKVGLVRALSDMLANQGETHNLTKQLLLPGAQKMLRQVLGKDADQFFKSVRAEQAMHRTYSSQFGSQTTPLREAIDELNWAPSFEAAWHNLGIGKILQLAQEYTARTINSKRNTDLMRLYTETDPLKQLESLQAMEKLHTARSNAGNAVGKPAVGLGAGVLPEALIATQEGQAYQPVMKPYRPVGP